MDVLEEAVPGLGASQEKLQSPQRTGGFRMGEAGSAGGP